MKTKIALPVLLMLLAGCGASRLGTAYRSLVVSKASNQELLVRAEAAKDAGTLAGDRLELVSRIGERWSEAHNVAVTALEAYAVSKDASDYARFEAAFASMIQLSRDIQALLEEQ